MLQRVQTLWMAVTAALVAVVIFMPVIYFSAAGAEFRLMTYGVKEVAGSVLVWGGEEGRGELVVPFLSIAVSAVLAVAALVPLVAIFLFKRRGLQMMLLRTEFAVLAVGAGALGYAIWMQYRVVSEYSENFYFSFFPLLLVVAAITNTFALRGVLRDEILVRAADRIR